MSRLSEQREQEAATPKKSGPRWIWLVAVIVVLVGAWVAYDLFYYRNASTLDGFAKCLATKGARMYGAWWCPHCADQKELFGYAFQYVNYHECSPEGQRTETEECKQVGIKHFPTWQFADGSRTEGILQLTDLSQKTGCKLP
jgi:hypothetical protein